MLKILERSITLQLFVFYGLFILPLLLGGAELYFFERDALQQSAQQADLGLAQAIALSVESNVRSATEEIVGLSLSQAATHLDLQQLTSAFAIAKSSHPDVSLYAICDPSGKVLLIYPSLSPSQSFNCHTTALTTLMSSKPFISSGHLDTAMTTPYVVSIANRIIGSSNQPVGVMVIHLSLEQFTAHLMSVRRQLASDSEVRIWILDNNGWPLANTEGIPPQTNRLATLSELKNALMGKSGNFIAHEQDRNWLYSYVPIAETQWAIVIQRPTDVTFATLISFQNSLIIALVTLLFGASVFWFIMHGWVVVPLARLAQAATLIRPDQMEKVTDSKLLTRERIRTDEIGKLSRAFAHMEEEIHTLFRKTDERSQARLRTLDAIMGSMDEGVILESPEGNVIYANHSIMQSIGISPQELPSDVVDSDTLSEKLLDLIVDHISYHDAMRRAEDGSGVPVIEFQLRGYYNQVRQLVPVRRDIRMRLFKVRDAAGQVIGRGKILQDVTRQNETEQVKKNLLAIVSHELRTPLTIIKGYATTLLATDIELDAALQEDFVRRIVDQSDRMADLVTSILEMSQLEAGTLKLYPALYRLDVLLEQVIPPDERCLVQTHLPKQLPFLYVDKRRIDVVVRNLLENARRYAGATATISIVAHYEQDQLENGLDLSIMDNGPGIPAHLLERIFDRFYQVDEGRNRGSSGVGLGLAICRGIIEAHGGRIWAENRTDETAGAIFHTWFPAKLLRIQATQGTIFELNKAL